MTADSYDKDFPALDQDDDVIEKDRATSPTSTKNQEDGSPEKPIHQKSASPEGSPAKGHQGFELQGTQAME